MAGERVVGKDAKRGPKHLRPSTAAINAERKAQGALQIGEFAAAPPAWVGPDTDVLFLYVEFNDLGCSFTPAQMQANMFGATATGPGNLADYYDEISYGALQIDGQVVGDAAGTDCIPLGNSHDFYDGAGGSADQMVTDAVAAADAYVDFSQFDNDGNGVVDALGLIYAGGGTHDGCATDDAPDGSGGDSLWPHSGGVGPLATGDGVTVESAYRQFRADLCHLGPAAALRRLRRDADDRAVRPRVRALARTSGPVRHGRQLVRRRSMVDDGLAVREHRQQRRYAAAFRPVEQVVPRLGHAHGLHRSERLGRSRSGGGQRARSPSSSPIRVEPSAAGAASTSSSRTASWSGSIRASTAAASSSGISRN